MSDTAKCQTCSAEFEPRIVRVGDEEVFRQLHCSKCVEEQSKHLNKIWALDELTDRPATGAREATWTNLCPLDYRTLAEGGNTDPVRLAQECAKLGEVTGWKLDAKGLLLSGSTGKGKTRAAWRLLRRIHEDGGSIRALTSGTFGREFADASGKHVRMEWFTALTGADMLLIDDLGKSRWTAGVWGEFFEVIEARNSDGKPTVLTTNETNETLGEKAKAQDPELWAPLSRRLKEFKRIAL